MTGAVPDQDEGEVPCEVIILEGAVPDEDEGEVRCEVTILEVAVPDQDEGEVPCEVTFRVLTLQLKSRQVELATRTTNPYMKSDSLKPWP